MSEARHPMAPHDTPGFITGADGSEPLFTAIVVSLLALVMALLAYSAPGRQPLEYFGRGHCHQVSIVEG